MGVEIAEREVSHMAAAILWLVGVVIVIWRKFVA